MRRRVLLALWLPLLVALYAVIYKTSFPALIRQRLLCNYTQLTSSNLDCSTDQPMSPGDGSWGDENGLHRWFDSDGVPVSYQTYQNLRGPFSPVPKERATLYKFGARIACWPSTGGIWIKHAVPLEMSFLDISKMYNTRRPAPPDAVEEDAFCAKLRLIGAEFWKDPLVLETPGCFPFEKCTTPQIQGHLGFTWLHGDHKGDGGLHLVNLTEANLRSKLPGLRGYYQAPDIGLKFGISQSLGGFWCPSEQEQCKKLWCTQYPDYCNEVGALFNDDILWDCQRKERGFY